MKLSNTQVSTIEKLVKCYEDTCFLNAFPLTLYCWEKHLDDETKRCLAAMVDLDLDNLPTKKKKKKKHGR